MGLGRFITLEGIDGSGKSTQAALLAEALEAEGHAVVRVREPGGTPLGEAVRALLLDTSGTMGPVAEACLFAASRAELVRTVVEPSLAAGRWVVCDRFLDSSLAYQGHARGIGMDEVRTINAAPVGDCVPDATVLIDVGVATARTRRCAGDDRIEAEGAGFQERVADAYHALAEAAPQRFVVVDGNGTPDEVHARVWDALAAVRA